MAGFGELLASSDDVGHADDAVRVGADREPGLLELGQGLGLGGRRPYDLAADGRLWPALLGRALDVAERVGPEVQRPLRRDGRVLLAQRAGGRVARVDEEALAQLGLALVHGLELFDGHVDFAADLEHVGIGAARLGQFLGHVADGEDVRRDVLAGDAVAAGGGLHEAALLVRERHGHAVDLGLARKGQRLEVEIGQLAAQAGRPGPQVVLAERVVEAHHRDRGAAPLGTGPTVRRPRRASGNRAWPARDSPPRAVGARRRGGRTRRRGSRAHRARCTARCCG